MFQKSTRKNRTSLNATRTLMSFVKYAPRLGGTVTDIEPIVGQGLIDSVWDRPGAQVVGRDKYLGGEASHRR
jgi:hypothetical protein